MMIWTILCLLAVSGLFIYTVFNIFHPLPQFKKTRREKSILFIKRYKKGTFLWIYLIATGAYLIGIWDHTFNSVFEAIKYAAKLVLLDFNYPVVANYASTHGLYLVTIIIIFVYTIFSTALFFMSVLGQYIKNWAAILWKRRRPECYFIYGYNEKSIMIANSCLKRSVIIDFLTPEEEENLYIKKISYVNLRTDREDKYVDNITKLVKKNNKKDKKVIAIINDTLSDSLPVVTRFAEFFKEYCAEYKFIDDYRKGLMLKVFVDPIEVSAYETITKETKGRIQMINKYKVLSFDFVSNHPITEYMNGSIIDFDDGSIRDYVKINMIYIGFGDTNQQIFLDEFANNALYTNDDGSLHLKRINYMFFDKERADSHLALNHSVFRYFLEKKELEAQHSAAKSNIGGENYVPFPETPFEYDEGMFKKLDVNDPEFYKELFKNIGKKNTYNYIHICFGSDMENYDLASKIINKLDSMMDYGVTKVFVRIRSDVLASSIASTRLICFGMDSVINNVKNIENEVYYRMELYRHVFYKCDSAKDTSEDVQQKAMKDWEKMPSVKRRSNIYSCLNLRVKLNLIGYDLVEASSHLTEVSEEEFLEKYAKDDELEYKDYSIKLKDKSEVKPVDHDLIDIRKNSLRNKLAQQEHMRWNLYMIMSGFIPTLGMIPTPDKEKYEKRIHWNITNNEGLLRQEKVSPTIKYDYQIMDSCYWLAIDNGMKIVKKQQ
ncbi:MAG: hypothetical protein J5666_09100 [Bacilli bacterium]|nr:hypothetical protein [Bacilli bacterium]